MEGPLRPHVTAVPAAGDEDAHGGPPDAAEVDERAQAPLAPEDLGVPAGDPDAGVAQAARQADLEDALARAAPAQGWRGRSACPAAARERTLQGEIARRRADVDHVAVRRDSPVLLGDVVEPERAVVDRDAHALGLARRE